MIKYVCIGIVIVVAIGTIVLAIALARAADKADDVLEID